MSSLLMTKKEAMTELRISQTVLDRFIRTGELKSIKIGGCRRIKREELLAFLNRVQSDQVSV